ncbi:MAG TPA: DUF4845 domain-containing protein [Gammaproteobacteria bacterium]|nr:DUF4845 domain-containing protein [Gammaproteobacteria bacterium]
MKKMTNNQKGVTFLGWCVILAVIGFFVLVTLRLFPLYNEKFQVVQAMNSVATRSGMSDAPTAEVLRNFKRTVQVGGNRRFDDVSTPKLAKVEKPKTKGAPRTLRVAFEARNIFFDDIYFVMDFDHSVELTGVGE